MRTVRHLSHIVARVFLSVIFLLAGFEKLFSWHETENFLMEAICNWQSHLGFLESMQSCFSLLVPWAPFLLTLGTLCELLGGVMLLIGYKQNLAAILLILFLIPTTFLFHSFWFLEGATRDLQIQMFFKNLAIIGGLLFAALESKPS